MKIDWQNAPPIKYGQEWRHKRYVKVMVVAGKKHDMVFLKSKSGRKNHHTTEKDVYLHFTLLG